MERLVEVIEDNKEQFNSQAYKELMDAAAVIKKQLDNKIYVIEVFFSRPIISDFGNHYLFRNELLRAELRQTTLNKTTYEAHQELERMNIVRKNKGYVTMPIHRFLDIYLTPENEALMMTMERHVTVDSSTDGNRCDSLVPDTDMSTVMFRITVEN